MRYIEFSLKIITCKGILVVLWDKTIKWYCWLGWWVWCTIISALYGWAGVNRKHSQIKKMSSNYYFRGNNNNLDQRLSLKINIVKPHRPQITRSLGKCFRGDPLSVIRLSDRQMTLNFIQIWDIFYPIEDPYSNVLWCSC